MMRATRRTREDIRIGIDLQSIDDVAQAIKEFGTQYTSRIYTEHEIMSCQGDPYVTASGLAGRFAAKEAVIKVLNINDDAPGWQSIEVRRHHTGRPDIVLSGDAAHMAHRENIEHLSVSLSHSGGIAAAAVIARISKRRSKGANFSN